MDLVIQYGLQAASGLLILSIGAFLARSAGRYTHKALGKMEVEPPVRLLCGGVRNRSHADSFPTTGNSHAQRKLASKALRPIEAVMYARQVPKLISL